MKIKKFFMILASMFISSALIVPVFAYTGYDITFIPDAIDGTTRWVAPLKSGTSYLYATITSKWNEQRTTGTSPHIGVDVSISASNVVVAVASGTLSKDTSSDGQSYNNIALRTPPSAKSVYCHYEHCATVYANGSYAQGDQVGVGGDYGSPGQPHLHFAAYDTNRLDTRKGYRNETLYRNAGTWNNGRNCDTFSVMSWLSNTTAQVTLVFSGANNTHTERPSAAEIYYRVHGTTSWIGPNTMANSGSDFNYSYNFKNGGVPSGTQIDWVVRYKRSSPSAYMWAPAKYYNPSANPNGSTNPWAYVLSTVSY